MIVIENLENGYVKIKSDSGKKIIRDTDGKKFSEAIQEEEARITYTEEL